MEKHPVRQTQATDVHDKNRVYTLITGASTGLGKAFALECAARGMHLILVALPGEGLAALAAELQQRFQIDVVPYEADLTGEESIEQLSVWVQENFRINFLINNAGVGGSAAILSVSHKSLKTMLRLNVEAAALLTFSLLNELKSHPKSYVLNVSSIIALCPVAFKTFYPATKTFVYVLSRGLYQEFRGTGLHVSVVLPGPLATNGNVQDRIKTHGWLGRFLSLSAEPVAKVALEKTLKKRPVIIPGFANKLTWILLIVFPTKFLLPFLSRRYAKEVARLK